MFFDVPRYVPFSHNSFPPKEEEKRTRRRAGGGGGEGEID